MNVLRFLTLFICSFLYAQEEVVQSVYFEFDKFNLDEIQGKSIVDYIKKTDSTRIASIQIFGYTDDIGKEEYNYKLSSNRANTIKETLLINGVRNKIIVTIEGKGRILIDDDIIENLPEKRSKNRRVDVVINLKELPKIEIPGFYNSIPKKQVVGDHIYLENLLFESGSSKLNFKAKEQLDLIVKELNKYKNFHFEIQGHVCCIPYYQKEAIDLETRKRELSVNRAASVYSYLVFKKIAKERMTFKGYGNTVPLGKGSEYDRRVELLITKI
jgi:outer membrane protein OmpA-like peptidoglycan-associated protein